VALTKNPSSLQRKLAKGAKRLDITLFRKVVCFINLVLCGEYKQHPEGNAKRKLHMKRFAPTILFLCGLALGLGGCAEKNLADINVSKMAEYSDRLGQANVKLYTYASDVKEKDIKTYVEHMGCNMLYAYFYPDTVPINKIPVQEILSATSFAEVQNILYEGEGFARWRYAAQCFAVIPIVSDCYESRVSQNCR